MNQWGQSGVCPVAVRGADLRICFMSPFSPSLSLRFLHSFSTSLALVFVSLISLFHSLSLAHAHAHWLVTRTNDFYFHVSLSLSLSLALSLSGTHARTRLPLKYSFATPHRPFCLPPVSSAGDTEPVARGEKRKTICIKCKFRRFNWWLHHLIILCVNKIRLPIIQESQEYDPWIRGFRCSLVLKNFR